MERIRHLFRLNTTGGELQIAEKCKNNAAKPEVLALAIARRRLANREAAVGTSIRHSSSCSPLFPAPMLGKLNRVFFFRHPFLPVTPMSTPDKLYDEAIELQQAGKLDEAVTRLESLAQSQPDFALAHAALAPSIASRAVMARPWSRPSWYANWMPTTRSATWPRVSSASGRA